MVLTLFLCSVRSKDTVDTLNFMWRIQNMKIDAPTPKLINPNMKFGTGSVKEAILNASEKGKSNQTKIQM